MINIKTAATVIAAATVAGVSAHQIITRTRKNRKAPEIETTIVNSASPELAFHLAQDVISERTLAGYYDDKTNDEAFFDFQILFNTYNTK